jgi:ABC-type multidrug transport system ATPase subunit
MSGTAAAPASWSELVLHDLVLRRTGRTVIRHGAAAVRTGELALLTGPNGSGKTTLLEALAGRLPIAAGSLEVSPQESPVDPSSAAWRLHTGYAPARDGTVSYLTVGEHMALVELLCRPATGDRGNRLVELWGLATHHDHRAEQLSDGLRKRLTLALALVAPARLYLLDEPTASLDIEGSRILGAVLTALTDAGAAVIVASHAPHLVLARADRVWTLQTGAEGSVLCEGGAAAPSIPAERPDLSWLLPASVEFGGQR